MLQPTDLVVSEEEFAALQAFKEKTASLSLSDVNLSSDWSLIRFLRARRLDLQKSFEMISKTVEFRRSTNFLRQEKTDFWPAFSEFLVSYVHGFYGHDREGHPLRIDLFSQSNGDRLIEIGSRGVAESFYIHMHERLINIIFPLMSEKFNRRIDRISMIVDFKGFPLLKALSENGRKLTQVLISVNQDYYPEIMNRVVLINAPIIFSAVFAVAKGFIDKKTQEKIAIESGPAHKLLQSIVEKEILPVALGGSNPTPLLDSFGPYRYLVNKSIQQRSFFMEDRFLESKWFGQSAKTRQMIMSERSSIPPSLGNSSVKFDPETLATSVQNIQANSGSELVKKSSLEGARLNVSKNVSHYQALSCSEIGAKDRVLPKNLVCSMVFDQENPVCREKLEINNLRRSLVLFDEEEKTTSKSKPLKKVDFSISLANSSRKSNTNFQ